MMRSMRLIVLSLLLVPALLLARQKTNIIHPGVEVPYNPWFTGPLLAPTPINMVPGHPAIEPSVAILATYGQYQSDWGVKTEDVTISINPFVDFQFGITDNTGIELLASFVTNFKNGNSSTHFQDTILLFGYQVSDDVKDSWIPDFRLFLQTNYPSGKFKRLDPELEGIDSTGQGAYFVGPNLSFQKLFYLPKNFFVLHWSLGYIFPTRAKLRDLNAYGGGSGTKGHIRPGQTLIAFISGEYSINQKWVLAFDSDIIYQRRSSRFRGKPGLNPDGTPAAVGLPSSVQFSFVPQFEYNFDSHSGLLVGAWFTVFGRNAEAFAGAFLAFLYIF